MSSKKNPNQDALYDALNIYRDAMRSFVFKSMKAVSGLLAEENIQSETDIDINDFPHLFRKHWNVAFAQRFDPDREVRSAVGVITEARNRVSHPGSEDLPSGYASGRLYEIADILRQIHAPEQKREVEAIRDKLLTRSVSTPDVRSDRPKLPRRKVTNLTPWRNVIHPNNDVIEGTFRNSEFAADLQEVYEGRAKTDEYGKADIFFNQTYITPGLRQLLVNTLKRLSGKTGNPVIQLKTGFGGGKTHSLIALYHLISETNTLSALSTEGEFARLRQEIDDIMVEAGLDPDAPINANISVLVGTYLSTTDSDKTKEGDPLNTLWGKMADQLGGQDAYEFIREAALEGISPGGKQLDELFEYVGPSVILIDELVAYVRNVQAVTQESIYTFFQTLTESVKRSHNVTLVATLPEGKQAGGQGGVTVLDELEEILKRVDAVSIPLEVDNAFEVVRRRLFGPVIDKTERDQTCEAFRKMYQNARSEYPDGVNDQQYLQRMKDCYPIHPEIFDRLFQDWSVIPGFQKTRGVLRIMATYISRLYREQDQSLLIMPANLPLEDPALADEFTRLLAQSGGNWDPVVQEVDSYGSRTDEIDRKSTVFVNVGGAARRIARTVFFGSATGGAFKGITTPQIHLGVVEPGQTVSTYNDALGRMTGNLYYLYHLDDRYYFHTQENLNKVAIDRANQYTDENVYSEIVSRLERAIGRDPAVKVCPTSPSMVEDTEDIQFVILPPQASLASREKDDDTAHPTALDILKYSGDDESKQRIFKNTLLFITTKRDDIRELRNLVKSYLAWNSIMSGDDIHSKVPNLVDTRFDQTKGNLESADDAIDTTLFKAYRWGLVPTQNNPQRSEYDFSDVSTKTDNPRIVSRMQEQFIADDTVIKKIDPSVFSGKLQQYIWSSDTYQEHIEIDTLWGLMAQNVYMPRLKDRGVLSACIKDGVLAGTFGFAHAYTDGAYDNFRFEENVGVLRIDKGTTAVLINPELAKIIKEEKEKQKAIEPPEPKPDEEREKEDKSTGSISDPTRKKGPKHVVITKTLQLELPFADEIGVIQDEIVRTLKTDGGNVKIEVVVTADKSDGFSENTTRSVKLNSEHIDAEFKSD